MNPADDLPPDSSHPPPADDPFGPSWIIGPRFIERAQDFEVGFHTEAYLRWRFRMTGLDIERLPTPSALEAMRAAGYADWTKFLLHLPLWHNLSRSMPRSYADFIGVREKTLLAAAEQDRADARRALDLPSRPRVFGGKYFGPIKFPSGCQDEQDCLAYATAFTRQKGPPTFFRVSGLKKYSITGGASARITQYEFHVRIRRKHIEFVQEEQTHDVPIPNDTRSFSIP